jgi:hypothetical protein
VLKVTFVAQAGRNFFPFVNSWHGFVAFMALAWGLGEMRGNGRQVTEHIMVKKCLQALLALAEHLCVLRLSVGRISNSFPRCGSLRAHKSRIHSILESQKNSNCYNRNVLCITV